jgi:chaperone modulatory protein CbpM
MTAGGPARPDPPARYPLAHPLLLSVEQFGDRSGLHPDLVRRFVALGLLQAERDAAGRLRLRPDQVAAVARIQRLRAGLSLNYAAVGLVVDLLDRISELETVLNQRRPNERRPNEQRPNTRRPSTRQRSSRWS